MRFSRIFFAIVLAGLVAGTIDIGAACLINGLAPKVILQAIASGVLGKASFAGGARSAVFGLFLQWGMSVAIAAIYAAAAHAIPVLARRWISGGLAYGVGIYVVMNFIVVPLSNAPFRAQPFDPAKGVKDLLAMLLFGLIVARMTRPARE
jgi:uncharacterized membrane protein YagU involved in acid resistance